MTAVGQYEDQEEAEKIVQHMGGFHDLLNHLEDNDLISDEAFDILQANADELIERWQ